MDVIGIGNAIVDVICKVDETFLAQNKLKKSTFQLISMAGFDFSSPYVNPKFNFPTAFFLAGVDFSRPQIN